MSIFVVAFIVVFCALTGLRLYYRISTGAIRDGVSRREGPVPVVLRWILGVPLFFSVFTTIASPDFWPWMYLELPTVARIGGVLLAAASLLLLAWVHRCLGRNFSSTLVIRSEHRLVTNGPYRLVRHPMYSAYLLFFLGTFLISGNWIVGASGVGVIATLMTLRLAREEALLEERFDAAYREYRSRTGMFIPMTARLERRLHRAAEGGDRS